MLKEDIKNCIEKYKVGIPLALYGILALLLGLGSEIGDFKDFERLEWFIILWTLCTSLIYLFSHDKFTVKDMKWLIMFAILWAVYSLLFWLNKNGVRDIRVSLFASICFGAALAKTDGTIYKKRIQESVNMNLNILYVDLPVTAVAGVLFGMAIVVRLCTSLNWDEFEILARGGIVFQWILANVIFWIVNEGIQLPVLKKYAPT